MNDAAFQELLTNIRQGGRIRLADFYSLVVKKSPAKSYPGMTTIESAKGTIGWSIPLTTTHALSHL